MSAPKHTPGPWRFSSDGHIVSASTGERVCTPHSTLLGGKVSDQIKDLKRNARLIAAAPETAAERDRLREVNAELLAALKKLCADCNGDNLGTVKAPRWAVLCAAETAIAKATGGEA
jgi:hypothetical protein